MEMSRFLGKQFGSYRLIKEIARGGYGSIYQAQHVVLTDRLVAIKVLHDFSLSSSQECDAFLREAQFLERLKHPFVLLLLDIGIQQNIPFLVTEYAPAGSLRLRLQAQSPHLFPFHETLTILSQIGEALQYAHQQNIIHRDLKPDNILFNLSGDALLADFGIASLLSTASLRHTRVIGTPAYMAPEQFRGHVSRATDQYSLGCLAYELVTGQKPFTASDFIALGFKHAMEDPVPPRHLNPSIPPHVEQAVLKAMAKERSQRYPDVRAFITALQSPSFSLPPPHVQTFPSSSPYAAPPLHPSAKIPSVSTSSASEVPPISGQHLSFQVHATASEPSRGPTSQEKTLALLSYLSPLFLVGFLVAYPVILLVLFRLSGNARFVRFHLIQALFLTLTVATLGLTLALVGYLAYKPIGIGGDVADVIGIVSLVVYGLNARKLIGQLLRGQSPKLPLIGSLAEKYAQ